MRIQDFLRGNQLDPARLDLRGLRRAFLQEMERGLRGRPSSLPMIPTYLDTSRAVSRGQRVIALDAGGTNMRVAAVHFDGAGAPVIEGLTRHRMPGVDAAVSREEFFGALADAVRPHLRGVDRIGFCFSYPAEITPQKDGRLIQFTKEIKATGVEGQLVGAGLAAALARGMDAPAVRIVLLNDTVATLLAGRNAVPSRRFDDFVGLVCGTGFNAAYVEANSLIQKAGAGDAGGSQVVNTESGSFGRGARGAVDDAFDATTTNPGHYRHEKTISGAYLGALCLFAARRAAGVGCFGADMGLRLEKLPVLATKDVDEFLRNPDSAENPLGAACRGAAEADSRALYLLCDTIVERAAAMVAVNLSAMLAKTGRGTDPRYPVCITADGTTFWQLRAFPSRVQFWMRRLLDGEGRAWEVEAVDDAPLLGAAIAALTN